MSHFVLRYLQEWAKEYSLGFESAHPSNLLQVKSDPRPLRYAATMLFSAIKAVWSGYGAVFIIL